MTGTLYLVATPLGNLGDMTYRGVETLQQVAVIAAEDTRRARVLCDHFGVRTPLVSMPAFREESRSRGLIERLLAGEDVAVISDAGSPGISDPGTLLVQRAIEAGVRVVPIPGASAVVAALSASGLRTDRFHFVGFLPRGGQARQKELAALAKLPGTLVLYESPRRLGETLRELASHFGARQAVVARELTKVHEEFVRGTLEALAERFAEEPRGEITLLIEGAPEADEAVASDESLLAEIGRRLASGERSIKEIAAELAELTGRPRKEIYALALRARSEGEGS